jgi:hypothetical protein
MVILCSVQCPGELMETDRGRFVWEPVAHGVVSTLPCPYGMSTSYKEDLENLAHGNAVGLGYRPYHNPTAQPKPEVKTYDLQNGNAYHELISDVSHENSKVI